ncbi:putative NRPS-like protein biosynthetic cluster [Botryosphaeria dothidea]
MDACHRAFGARLSQLYDDSSAKKMPVISYPTRGNGEFKDYTGEELARMVELAASLYVSALPERALRKNSDDPPKTIGLLGVSNLEYIITFLAAQRLGLTTLFFSIRLSDAGFAHLIEKTECQAVIVQSRYQAAMERAQTATGGSLVVVPMFEGTYLFNPAIMNAMKPLDLHFDPVREKEIPGGIIHSSGSSGLPKPVPTWWHRWLPFLDDRDVHKAFDNALITAPLYHGYGILNLMRTVVFGGRMAFMNANLPITGQQVLTALAASKCTCLLTVPYTLKLVADIPGAIDKMKALDMVQFGGSACPDELGDRLVAAGVTLGNSFGATETGGVMVRSRDQWNWLVPLPHAEPFMEFEHEGGGVYHLVLKPGLESKYFATRPDGSYDTKDLFRPHPTDPKKWKYVSRKDDTIVLVNGEKANPVPLEEAVKQHPDVQMAVGFGTQRDFLGMIVIPELRAASVPKQEMVERIWPRLEGANKIVPAYARISKDAVIVKDAGTPFPLTEKTTLKRAAFIQQFAGDIDAFYARMAGGGVEQHQQPRDRSEAGMRDLVRRTVRETLQLQDASELTDDADFFLLGMDSLQATQVRNVLAKELSVGADELPQNVAFDNPSVTRMAQFLVQMKQGAATSSSQEEVAMGLVKKYSQFPAINRKQTTRRPEKEVVVLTGATGSLGVHILNTLLHHPSVQRVYCLVRADSPNAALARIYAALKSARLLARLSPGQKEKIVALAGDLSQEHFALPPAAYDEMAAAVTTVVHNAWTVNFNMGLSSFEPHCIAGTHHLLSLCLRSSFDPLPTFAFVSTIGTVARSPEDPVRETLYPLAAAAAMGYAQSKWVTERVCAAASEQTGIATRLLRIGQIVGDSAHGMWNPKEAVPLTVLAALTAGALPRSSPGRDRLSWLPADVVARAVVELALLDGAEEGYAAPRVAVYHVCHPRTISWDDDFLPTLRRAGLRFETLPGPEWVRRLERSERDPEKNPPMKLLSWFQGAYGGGDGGAGDGGAPPAGDVEGLAETLPSDARVVTLDMTESRKAAPSLREPKTVGQEEMAKYLKFWKEEAWAGLPLAGSAKAKL